jgi:parallel beta-helix repeat protein
LSGVLLVVITAVWCSPAEGKVIRVDDDGQADFQSIQAGIEAAGHGDIVLVAPGTYFENITLRDGVNLIGSGPEVTIIDAKGSGDVVDARANEATIAGFTLRNSGQSASAHMNCGVYVEGNYGPVVKGNVILGNKIGIGLWYGAHPDIRNNVVENNSDGLYLFGAEDKPTDPNIINNTIVGNQGDGIVLRERVSPAITNNIIVGHAVGINRNYVSGTPGLSYNDLWGNEVNYLHDGYADDAMAGPGSLSVSPRFAKGGYHLQSQVGRYDPNRHTWVLDAISSPCIDAGDPNSPVAFEPAPNGGVINLGAYGGTAKASKSPSRRHARYGGGAGEPNHPYLIYTAEHLNAIGTEPNDWSKHFRLMASIDLSGSSYDTALIAPDVDPCDAACTGTPFAGVFDGNGHAISCLTINGGDYLGLFGQIEAAGVVENLRLEDVNIVGTDYVGAVAGFSRGQIATSRVTGTLTANKRVGGLAGRNWGSITAACNAAMIVGSEDVGGLAGGNYGRIADSYCTGTVAATRDVGGVAGENYGVIATSYSAGPLTGTTRVGGIAGYNSPEASITASFWDTQATGLTTSASGTGKTAAEMQAAKTFLEVGWDFVGETANGTEEIWWILEGKDYPRLWWEAPGK